MTYGVWSNAEKRFVFGIAAETPRKAERAFRKTCVNWRQWRYEIKPIPEGFKNPRNPHYAHLIRKGQNTMNSNEIILPCRLSYANIWEARQSMEGDKMQYSCCLLIPKTDTATIQRLQKLMTKIESEAVTTKWGGQEACQLRTPPAPRWRHRPDQGRRFQLRRLLLHQRQGQRRPPAQDHRCPLQPGHEPR